MEETDGQVEAVAEVIEPAEAEELSVRYSPAAIEANFDALEAHVRRVTEGYAGARYDLATAQGLRDAKHDRSYLNGLKKEIEERRKAVKRKYSRPLEAFERRCREITDIVDKASEGIKAQLDAAKAAQRSRRRDAPEAHYEEFVGLLAPVVPYGRLHEDRWLNKTCAEPKAIAELEEKVGALARDWETLKAQRGSMGHYEEAERKLFRTLDLGGGHGRRPRDRRAGRGHSRDGGRGGGPGGDRRGVRGRHGGRRQPGRGRGLRPRAGAAQAGASGARDAGPRGPTRAGDGRGVPVGGRC